MNPTDLLFTNQFISSETLSDSSKNLECDQIKPTLENRSIKKNRVQNELVELKEKDIMTI